MRYLIALLTLSLSAASAAASVCVAQPVVVRHAPPQLAYAPVVAQYVPVAVPAYTASFGQSDNTELLKRLDALIQQNAAMLQMLSPQALPLRQTVAGAKCGACHDGDGKKGGGVVLLRGGAFREDLTPEQRGKIIELVDAGAMPKGGKITDADKLKVVVEAVTTTPAPAEKK